MGEKFEGWTSWVEDAFLVCTPDDPECLKHPYITRTEKDEPQYTIEDEIAMLNKQINESEGFDLDFTKFRCVFNYHPVCPGDTDFVKKPGETTEDLMRTLSQESLQRYNQEKGTEIEYLKYVKANFHFSCGWMFLITFQVLDPSDKQEKTFQARLRYSTRFPTQFVFCRPKPDPNAVDSDETSEDDDEEDSDEASEEEGVKG